MSNKTLTLRQMMDDCDENYHRMQEFIKEPIVMNKGDQEDIEKTHEYSEDVSHTLKESSYSIKPYIIPSLIILLSMVIGSFIAINW